MFAYRLGKELGEANIDGLLQSITWQQFREWRAYETIEPFGDRRADWHAASICAAMWNATLASRGIDKQMTPEQMLLVFKSKATDVTKEGTTPARDQPQPAKDYKALKFVARMWTNVMNAEERLKNKRRKK